MDIFKPCYLLTDELNYELRIRGVVTGRDLSQRRKILTRCLEREKGRALELSDPEYDYEAETQRINRSLESIRTLIAEFDGPETDSSYKRIKSRLVHVMLRVQRIRIPDEDPAPVKVFKNESYATCLELDADLHEKVQVPSASPNISPEAPPVSTVIQQSEMLSPFSKNVPIYKWGVTFDGERKSSSLNSFLERVAELADARGVPKRALYSSAVDLFTGKALLWYRSVKNVVRDWDSLVLLLRQEFLPSDYDDQLWDEIKARKQGKFESVSIFIAIMETLFNRLSRPPAEVTRIKHIRQNLLPQYFSQLALLDVETLPELSKLCKKLEDAHLTQSQFRKPQKPYVEMLEPELAYVANSSASEVTEITASKPTTARGESSVFHNNSGGPSVVHSKNNVHHRARDSNRVSPVSKGYSSSLQKVNRSPLAVRCWNCEQPNHTYASCKLKRRKFCYRCGYINVTVSSCPKCSEN